MPNSLCALVASHLGGADATVQELVRLIFSRLGLADDGVPARSAHAGVLLHGAPGTGKTSIALALCKYSPVPCSLLSASTIFRKEVGESESVLLDAVSAALVQAPSVLIIDEIDVIASKEAAMNPLELRLFQHLCSCLDHIYEHRVAVVGITNRFQMVHPALFGPGRLSKRLKMKLPRREERRQILEHCLARINIRSFEGGIDTSKGALLDWLSSSTAGYVGADLAQLCRGSFMAALTSSCTHELHEWRPIHLSRVDFDQGLRQSSPSALLATATNEAASVDLDSLGGLDDALAELRAAVLWPLMHPDIFGGFGVSPSKGVLLHGPPGTGKTSLARVIAAEAQGRCNFVSVTCTDLISRVVGRSERAISDLFDLAREVAPCVLFLDQVDVLAPVRGHDSSTEKTFDRLLSTLLTEIDGIGSDKPNQNVMVLGATTNRAWLDPSILRPGRLDTHIRLDLPDQAARRSIVCQQLKRMPLACAEVQNNGSMTHCVELVADASDGWSGAMLKGVCTEAALHALREDIRVGVIERRHLEAAMQEATRSFGGSGGGGGADAR